MAKAIEENDAQKPDGSLLQTGGETEKEETKKGFKSKLKINRETLPLKITLFLFYGGKTLEAKTFTESKSSLA